MMDYEAFIKLEDDINKRPVTFTGTQAEWEALTTSQKAFYETVNITDDVQSGQATLNGVVLAGDKTSHQVGVANEANQGTVESYSTAQNAHDEGTCFINSLGQFVKATDDIAIGDTIETGVNVEVTNIAAVLSELNSKIANKGEAINLNNCSTIDEIFTAMGGYNMKALANLGRAGCGDLDSNNFKTLVGNPNIGNYTTAFVRVFGYQSDRIIAEIIAVPMSTRNASKHKYIFVDPYGHQFQSSWQPLYSLT